MKDKFKIGLVWHNCHSCPPKEEYNGSLIVTNGIDVFKASYCKGLGFPVLDNTPDTLSKYWWADIVQTIRTSDEFKQIKE